MFRNYLLTAWRHILKNRLFSAINIFGLAVGMMSCILIVLFVRSETGYDTWLRDSDRIVRMHTAYLVPDRPPFLTVRSAGNMMPALRDYATAEIESGVRLINFGATIQQDNAAFSETVTVADDSFFSVFDLPFAVGDADASYSKPYDLIVSEETAIKYFGRTDVVGETLTVCCVGARASDLKITGVLRDLPDNTHMALDMLVYLDPAIVENNDGLKTWTSVNVLTYFKMREGVTLKALQDRIYYWVNNEGPFREMFGGAGGVIPEDTKITDGLKHRVMAVPDLHLDAHAHAGNMGDMTPMGDRRMLVTFSGVAVLILLIACINFMNLATARASQRAREVAMRKVLGANRRQIAFQFLGEAVGLVLIALIFAVAGVETVLPFYNQALGTSLEFRLFGDAFLLLGLIGMALVVGLIAGAYPALYLSRFLPARILKANQSSGAEGSTGLRTGLVVFQFAISIALGVATAVVYGQTLFVNSMDVGYTSSNKLILNVGRAGEARESLRQELLALPGVTSVVYSSEAPTQDNENNRFFKLLDRQGDGTDNQPQVINYHTMGYGFFEAYDVQLLAGRFFSEAYGTDALTQVEQGTRGRASVILNEGAVRRLGFATSAEAIGQTLEAGFSYDGSHHLEIIGVIPDIYLRSLKFAVRPSVYLLNPDRFNMASITFETGNIPALVSGVERVWKTHVPLQPVSVEFLSEMMAAQYRDEQAQAKLFTAFSVLAIVVACLGLYGLAAFTADRRTREIGIRKVLGARVRDIVGLLVWQFSKPVVIANLIAWPAAWYFVNDWLEGFEYRVGHGFVLAAIVFAGIAALLLAWATVASRAFRVARRNPIHALRYE